MNRSDASKLKCTVRYNDRQLILAKSKEDKSRVISDDIYERFSANFEGSWNIINEKKEKTCIVYDCNTSGGSQLLSIVKEINELNNNTEVKLTPPSSVYILFCVDKQPVEETGNKFKDHGLELYRYFDLDEDIKKQLHDLKEKCIKEKRQPDFYNKNDKKAALLIIDSIKKKSKYFF